MTSLQLTDLKAGDNAPACKGAVERGAILIDAEYGAGDIFQDIDHVGGTRAARKWRMFDLRFRCVAHGQTMRPLSLGHLVDGEEDEGVVRVIHNTERLP